MKVIGNILWILLGGLWTALGWFLAGLLCCITIIGIPLGIQAFKMAKISFMPFGKEIVYCDKGGSIVLNIIWILLGGWWLALVHAIAGIIFFITIIGIPFGKQYMKLAKLALMPFGAEVRKIQSASDYTSPPPATPAQ
jgi:uncharacterized membrane protein YccF (DUF307 family)